MTFNPGKSVVLHVGKNNPNDSYYMTNKEGENIKVTESASEKDIGVTFDCDMKFATHINNITNKANRMIGLIKRCISHMDEKMFTTLYSSLVRPILE